MMIGSCHATGGVPETPKDPPRNFPAGASPSPDWQRCLFLLFGSSAAIVQEQDSWMPTRGCRCNSGWPHQISLIHHTTGVSLRSEVSKTLRIRGSTGTPCQCSYNSGVAKWKGSGFIRRVTPVRFRPPQFFPGPLDHSAGHPPCKRKSTVQSRGGPPFQSPIRVVSRVKTAGRL